MRFYKGMTYNFTTAVRPVGEFRYEILDVAASDGKTGCVLYGFDREHIVGAASRIILNRKINGRWKKRIIKIPFERKNGKFVFDLPDYLKKNGLKFKLYKREKLYEGGCTASHDPCIYCKNGSISWGSNWCVDYSEYWLSVDYNSSYSGMEINGKKVEWISFDRETHWTDTPEILEYFMKTLEEPQNLSYKEFGKVLDELHLHKENHFLRICLNNGNSPALLEKGAEIDWERE